MFYENRECAFLLQGVYRVRRSPKSVLEQERRRTAIACRLRGNTVFSSGGEEFHAGNGSVVYLPAGVNYERFTQAAEEMIVVHLTALGDPGDRIEVVENIPGIEILFETMQHEWASGRSDRINRCMSLLYTIFARLENAGCTESQLPECSITPGIRALRQEFRNPELSVASLAQLCHVSETYFRRIYRQQYGCSPLQTILDLRFVYAQDLLRSGYYPVKEVAALSGFTDVKYFRTAFCKRFGITPSEYSRQSLR